MLKSQLELGRLRGRFAEYGGLPLMPTHHPSELLVGEMLKAACLGRHEARGRQNQSLIPPTEETR